MSNVEYILQSALPPHSLSDFGITVPDAAPHSSPSRRPPQPAPPTHDSVVQRETAFNMADARSKRDHHLPLLNPEQRSVYNRIMEEVEAYKLARANHTQQHARVFFLHSVGGGGKTLLLDLLLNSIRLQHDAVAQGTAATGVAAQLLTGGQTAHFVFNLALKPQPNLPSSISRSSATARMLQTLCLFICIDEATMLHKDLVDQIDTTLRDILDTPDIPCGGMPLIFAGDIGQTLPVIPHASASRQAAAAMCHSALWPHVQHLQLSTNMRIERARQQRYDTSRLEWFDRFLRSIRDGTAPSPLKVCADAAVTILTLRLICVKCATLLYSTYIYSHIQIHATYLHHTVIDFTSSHIFLPSPLPSNFRYPQICCYPSVNAHLTTSSSGPSGTSQHHNQASSFTGRC
jgi:hypothetical protein